MRSSQIMMKRLVGCIACGTSLVFAGSVASSQKVTSADLAKQVANLIAESIQVDHGLPRKDKTVSPSQMERLIRMLEGEWDTENIFEPSGPTLRKGTAHSLEIFGPGPTRLSLIEKFRSKDPGDGSTGLGIFWWEQASPGIHVLWCDNATPGDGCRLLSSVGAWQGDDFVLTDVRYEMQNQTYRREVWSDFKPDSFTQTIFQGKSMDTMRKLLTIKAHRVGVSLH